MLAAAFPLLAVPAAWYALGVVGAALHPRGASRLTALAAVRGAAVLIVVTWVATRWLSLPGAIALALLGGTVAVALAVRGARGTLGPVVVPGWRDLPMLALATAILTAWMAPITRHGVGSIGTGNHADLPSYLLQAVQLFHHGFDATGALPGIRPEERMFDAFGASALLAPSTAVSAAPSAGVMVLLALGAVLTAQLVERMASRALGGSRLAPVLLASTLLLSWAFTFNAFAYFLAQVWGLTFGLALIAMLLIEADRGPPAALGAAVVSVAGALTYNPTGAMYAAVALLLAAWLSAIAIAQREPVARSPAIATIGGIAGGGLVFLSVWHDTFARLWNLRDAVAGWPMPTAPLWAAVGVPIAERGDSTPAILAGSVAIGAAGTVGWLATPRGRSALAHLWPLALPGAVWIYRAWADPGSYQQWKAFSYAQPLLLLWVGCGLTLLARSAGARLPAAVPAQRARALEQAVALGLVACAATYAFWPRSYFADGGCCIASGEQIAQIQDAAARVPGPVRVSAGGVWANDVATAIVSATRPASVDPPSIWPSDTTGPAAGVVSFETGSHPSLVEGRFVLREP